MKEVFYYNQGKSNNKASERSDDGWNVKTNAKNQKLSAPVQKVGIIEDILNKQDLVPKIVFEGEGNLINSVVQFNENMYVAGGRDDEMFAFNKDHV